MISRLFGDAEDPLLLGSCVSRSCHVLFVRVQFAMQRASAASPPFVRSDSLALLKSSMFFLNKDPRKRKDKRFNYSDIPLTRTHVFDNGSWHLVRPITQLC